MDTHIEEKITLDTLSKIFFISKTQIFRLFKEEYGLAPMQYFMKEKIELAKKRLLNTALKISEIADALSFSDAKHFAKTFYKYTGMLPSTYRKYNS
jgi:AraC-like DNA-binding protein